MNFVTGQIGSVPLEQDICYIAAPFFNAPQLRLVKEIEGVFEYQSFFSSRNVWAFSPRLQHGPVPTPITNKAQARQAFNDNYRAIECCKFMVAVVDWLMPAMLDLRVVKEFLSEGLPTAPLYEGMSPPLNLPDAGTVWEMGVAFALKKPVVMLTLRPPTDKLNIMLTESCIGIARGVKALEEYLHGQPLEQWEGKYT